MGESEVAEERDRLVRCVRERCGRGRWEDEERENEDSGFNIKKGFDVEVRVEVSGVTYMDEKDRDVHVEEESVEKKDMEEEKERLAGIEVGQVTWDVVVEGVLLKNRVAG
ncbi:hypothetical protein E2C01_077466 [Portunus trituberculatus]|uniref:Uncharacterized protein n=1 Tax=Portunus trituberculatus TaxID=210409 RepID=A0A5B7IRE6_PORTR|nr:hypothetical protein [Portunus trituberculatus]